MPKRIDVVGKAVFINVLLIWVYRKKKCIHRKNLGYKRVFNIRSLHPFFGEIARHWIFYKKKKKRED